MLTDGHIPLSAFRIFERTSPTAPALADLDAAIRSVLSGLAIPGERLRGRRIAVTAGSRGIVNLREIVRAVCAWLREQGGEPFVFPAMGSHGGGTAEGQRAVLEKYGMTPDSVGAEVRCSMATVSLGSTPDAIQVFMDRSAWEADAVLVVNRVKPHTGFTGKIESGLLKMMAIGMGKVDGAQEAHRWCQRYGYEKTIRSAAAKVLATGKILCGLAVIENEMHQICGVRAAQPRDIVAMEESALEMARRLVPRIPCSKLHLLIVDELGKNIAGTGMDTKVIGRGIAVQPGDSAEIRFIYVRDLTPESDGNALGVGMADIIHERLYRKIDLQKIYLNVRTSLNASMARLPMYLPSDREALGFALSSLGSPEPQQQRVAWIKNTLRLDRIAVSASLADELRAAGGWRPDSHTYTPHFDTAGDLASPLRETA